VEAQARRIIDWLGDEYRAEICEGVKAFEQMDDCDLLVLMGLHWTGMTKDSLEYRPMLPHHQQAFERYVASGRPLLAHHGAIASYDDWPRFGELIGFAWIWEITKHSPLGTYRIHTLRTGHPVIDGVNDYTIEDELYYNVRVNPNVESEVHAEVEWDGLPRPMVSTLSGVRTPGAGKVVYLANGHDQRAFESPAIKRLWINSVRWLLG
jgi:type 1 glutamine amidotransferase